MKTEQLKSLLLAVVPTPMTASGAVSPGDLQRYVRWFRGAPVDGVVAWTCVGGGAAMDPTEREELYAVWRSGLLPQQQVWVQVPAGDTAATSDGLRFQAAQARELGADGVLTSPEHAAEIQASLGVVPLIAVAPDHHTHASPSLSVRTSLASALRLPIAFDVHFAGLSPDGVAAALLATLAKLEVISQDGSFTPLGEFACTSPDARITAIRDALATAAPKKS